jgi:hypothetical protein
VSATTRPIGTLQRLEPLTGAVIRPFTLTLCAVVVGYVLLRILLGGAELRTPSLVVAAGLSAAAAAALLAWRSSPLRAPIGPGVHVAVLALGLLAMVLAAASSWGANSALRDDWAPVAVGLLAVAISPYRPPRELVSGAVVVSVFAGFLALLQADAIAATTTRGVLAVIAMTPILALSLGGAAYVGSVTAAVSRARAQARRAERELAVQRRAQLAEAVRQERLRILAREVIPFYEEVLARGAVVDADRDRARDIADGIRSVMVAEVGRTWLDVMLAEAGRPAVVRDPGRLAEAMSSEQRAALRAMLLVLLDRPGPASGTALSAEIAPAGTEAALELRCALDPADAALRSELTPFFAVLRFVFSELDVSFTPSLLTLRLRYDRP